MMSSHRSLSLLFALVLPAFLVAILQDPLSGQAPAPKDIETTDSAGQDAGLSTIQLLGEFAADEESMRGFYGPPQRASALQRWSAFYQTWLDRLEAIDFPALGQPSRIDFLILRNDLQRKQSKLGIDGRRMEEISPLLPFADAILDLHSAYREQKPMDAKEAASTLAKVRDSLESLRQRTQLKDAPADPEKLTVSRIHALRAEALAKELRRSLQEWSGFHEGFDPTFTWWTQEPLAACITSFDAYIEHLGKLQREGLSEEEAPLIGDPIGEEALVHELAGEMIVYTPHELITLADEEFAWCRKELVLQSRAMGLGDDWRSALDKVKEAYVDPGKQDEQAAQSVNDAIQFMDKHELVTIPSLCRETWYLTMLTRSEQEFLPYAVYRGQSSGIAYPTVETPHEKKLMSMRGNNRHFTRIVMAHELIPGHHLQAFHARRINAQRAAYRTPFFVEGWALHWEMLLYEMDYARTPEEKIGMLFWRAHRCARILVSLRFHLGTMTPEEMVTFLVQEVGMERAGARGEVRRYIGDQYSPLYQCAYMTGGLQLRALYREIVGKGKMTRREFHDAVLRENAIPIELIRSSLLDLPLSRDHQPGWKFLNRMVEDR